MNNLHRPRHGRLTGALGRRRTQAERASVNQANKTANQPANQPEPDASLFTHAGDNERSQARADSVRDDQGTSATGSGQKPETDAIDFTADNPKPGEAKPDLLYDSRPAEDGARRTIAFMLIGILFVIIGSVLIMVAFASIAVSDLKEFAVILGPVITLVSAATGFYYGTKSR